MNSSKLKSQSTSSNTQLKQENHNDLHQMQDAFKLKREEETDEEKNKEINNNEGEVNLNELEEHNLFNYYNNNTFDFLKNDESNNQQEDLNWNFDEYFIA